ncbi:hypothetical protein [Gracilibacillus timonensis]|uniref:hypothetical protein n=1 Tax=Gracilibacillus timonensis TaxID=1816696 RepID=UPI000823FDC6|nr:hypothetical protein [Gracilibacillus timonensis]
MQKKNYLIIAIVLLLVTTLACSWLYYNNYKSTQQLVSTIQERIASETYLLSQDIEPVMDQENYSEDSLSYWEPLRVDIEKLLKSIYFLSQYRELSKEERSQLHSIETTLRSMETFLIETARSIRAEEASYELQFCKKKTEFTIDSDANKRFEAYYQLLDLFDFEDEGVTYEVLMDSWDDNAANDLNWCYDGY